jgi:hypothetical protein
MLRQCPLKQEDRKGTNQGNCGHVSLDYTKGEITIDDTTNKADGNMDVRVVRMPVAVEI